MRFQSSTITILALALVSIAGVSQTASAQGFASIEQIQAMQTQAQWIDTITTRMEQRGKSISDADARSIRQINAQLAKFSKLAAAGGTGVKSGVMVDDALALQDDLAQVWVNIRAAQRMQPGAAEAAPPAAAVQYNLPSGTNAMLQLTTWLSSKNAQVGDRFSALLTEPIYAGGQVAIPAGAVFEGFVSEAEPAGRVSDSGKLHLYIDRLRGDAGQILDVRGLVVGTASGDEINAKGVNVGRTAAGGVAGAIVGGLLGGKKGALIGGTVGVGGTLLAEKGQNVDLPQGTGLRIQFQDSMSIPWTWQPR